MRDPRRENAKKSYVGLGTNDSSASMLSIRFRIFHARGESRGDRHSLVPSSISFRSDIVLFGYEVV